MIPRLASEVSFLDLADNDGFRTGLAVGIAVLLVTVVAVALVRASDRARLRTTPAVTRPPLAGFAVVIAGLIALDEAYPDVVTRRLLGGLALVAIGPTLVAVLGRGRWWSAIVAAVAAVPGAIVLARVAADVNPLGWVEVLVVGGIVIGGLLATDVDRVNAPAGLGPVLLAVTVTGCYVTLPDTEYIAVLLGVVLPLALLGFPVALSALGPGAYVAVGLISWVAAVEGAGRSSAVVGAFACLGLLLLEPIVRRALGPRARRLVHPTSPRTLAIVALQCGVVIVTSRIAGLEPSATRAGVISLGAWLLGAALLALILYGPPAPQRPGRARRQTAPTVPTAPAAPAAPVDS